MDTYLQRLANQLESRRGRWMTPLMVALLAFSLSAWTFDTKLSLTGDNTEFITLARSLAQGDGLSYLNQPDPRPATKYPFGFPLMLAPLAAVETGGGQPVTDWVAMKWLIVCLFAAGMAVVYLWLRELLGALSASIGALLCLTNPLLLAYSHQVMSEIPYLLFAMFGLLALARAWPASESPRISAWSVLGFVSMMWAYHVRSFGVVLIAALVLLLVMRRNWRQAAIAATASAVTALPWLLRNRSVSGGGFYVKQLFQVNPYQPELGYLDVSGFLTRLSYHVVWNLFERLPAAFVRNLEADHPLSRLVAVALVTAGIYAMVQCVRRRQFLLPVVYTVLSMGLVFSWPWVDERFLLPLRPLFIFFVLYTTRMVLRPAAGTTTTMVAAVILLLALGSNAAALVDLRDKGQAGYEPRWNNYFKAGLWLRNNGESGQIVACRKPFWMHVVSGLPTIVYPFKPPSEVVDTMQRRNVTYAVVEQLGFPQTPRFLVPAIRQNSERFRALWHAPAPDTYVLAFGSVTQEPERPPE
jgi:4-amino-4-deoxy-L-arabinose transferase-like glycosyltransferase